MQKKIPVILFFGYRFDSPTVGGLIWTRKIADFVSQNKNFKVRKIRNDITIDKSDVIFPLRYLKYALKAFFTNPDIAILSDYGEANLILWILLRIFKPKSKILVVCHHYEKKTCNYQNHFIVRFFESIYNYYIDELFKKMMINADRILTVSLSSASQIKSILKSSNVEIEVTGVGLDLYQIYNLKKDIDFICIGRFQKFKGLEKIWQLIKQKNPRVNFVVCGHSHKSDISRLYNVGIEHKGIVTEKEKIELLSRAKVLLFPSMVEGFGLVVAEALHAGLHVIAWKLPVFEEIYNGKMVSNQFKLVESWNYELFADEAISMLKRFSTHYISKDKFKEPLKGIDSWNTVGERLICILMEVLNR
jgi:glycosyltransferase involved in cell wall biosynthesis